MSAQDKKAFVLRINPQLLTELEHWAQDEFRSTNGQIEFLLHQALQASKRKKLPKTSKKDRDGQI
ncbi:Arc family DNA binding domain-containing protein [Pedobacter antarcticus]|uniref:Arc family DNA binding domain-containing protein n=1 Tax=Pedobacter antarcticus TaxID=34086 RepID=UPI001C575A37|nr:Arc family DNA binding domain-containing protein [Pedobacter antarcticus]